MMIDKKTVNVVAAVVKHGNHYLCTKRPEGKYSYTSNKWEFPGGKVEPGETEPAALVRELQEEMDYDIVVEGLLTTVTHQYPDFTINLSAYICHPAGDREAFILKEHIERKWLSKEELFNLDWAAADVGIVEALQ